MSDLVDPTTPTLDLALESWRFQRLFARAIQKMEEAEAARYATQHRYFVRRVGECLASVGLRFEAAEGQPYDPGDAITALNVGDFSPEDDLVVDQVIEPVVMGAAGLVRAGTVTVRRAN